MKLESQVCSLDLAKKLKELGVKQDSVLHWHQYGDQPPILKDYPNTHLGWTSYSAFTVAELGEMLPPAYSSSRGANNKFMCVNEMKSNSEAGKIRFADTEADTRAKMLIYLIENNLLKVVQTNQSES